MNSSRFLSWAVLAASFLHSVPLQATESLLVRSATNGRIWQVNLAPSEPIRWAWSIGSDAAKLTITNLTTLAVTEQVVTRAEGEVFGTCAYAVSPTPAEQVCTLAIEQYYHYGQETQKTVDTATARIAYLPGIHGAAVDIARARTTYVGEKRMVFSYDAAWSAASATSTVASVTCAPAGGTAQTRELEGTSGYDVLASDCAGKTDLALAFDGTTFWSRCVRFGQIGFVLLFR